MEQMEFDFNLDGKTGENTEGNIDKNMEGNMEGNMVGNKSFGTQMVTIKKITK